MDGIDEDFDETQVEVNMQGMQQQQALVHYFHLFLQKVQILVLKRTFQSLKVQQRFTKQCWHYTCKVLCLEGTEHIHARSLGMLFLHWPMLVQRFIFLA